MRRIARGRWRPRRRSTLPAVSVGWETSALPSFWSDTIICIVPWLGLTGVVGVLVAGDDLIDALPQQGRRIVPHAVGLPGIGEGRGPVASQMMALIEGAQGQQAGVAGDLSPGKIGVDGQMAVEGEGELW